MIRNGPTKEEEEQTDRWLFDRLVISVKAQHRRRIFCGALPQESFGQFASRALQREVKFAEDCTEAELMWLRVEMNNRGI